MKYVPIKDLDAYRLLDEPHNTGTGSPFEPEEWHATIHQLRRLLDQFGESDAFGDGDYYLPDSANSSRVIPVVFTSQKMVMPHVIEEIVRFLKGLREDYRLDVTLSSDFDYFLFLSKAEIRGWCPEELELKAGLERVGD
ncbi:MAG: hypothetical protein MUF31_18000 [Akkermansiaceae bacterium]|nr:hypothetical protein [Akkermansiaceae bacterium]